jgi:hypothetical protein
VLPIISTEFDGNRIVIAPAALALPIRMHAAHFFKQAAHDVFNTMQLAAVHTVRQYVQKLPEKNTKWLATCQDTQSNCVQVLSMPDDDYWIENPNMAPTHYEIDHNAWDMVLMLEPAEYKHANKALDLYKKEKLPVNLPSHLKCPEYESTHPQYTAAEAIRRFLLAAMLGDEKRLVSDSHNPLKTLVSWIWNAPAGTPDANDLAAQMQAYAIFFLSGGKSIEHRTLIGALHDVTMKNAWPVKHSPIWVFRTMPVEKQCYDIWDWTEEFLGRPIVYDDIFEPQLRKDMLNAQLGSPPDQKQLKTLGQYSARAMENSPSKRSFLRFSGAEEYSCLDVERRAVYFACMGYLPRPIPHNFPMSNDSALRAFIQHSPTTYALQLMKSFISVAILQHGQLLSNNSLGANRTTSIESAQTELRAWLLKGKEKFYVEWDQMVNHLFFIYDHLELYSVHPEMHRAFSNHNDTVILNMPIAWQATDPTLYHKNKDFFDGIAANKKAFVIKEVSHGFAKTFRQHLLIPVLRLYGRSQF